jgi:UDP-3-O-[3-hydroxymyristoyl] N-acetylglucosamine deacetylase
LDFVLSLMKSKSTKQQLRKQRTLRKAATYSGIGIHTGRTVSMRFIPAPDSTGVVFQRVDLPSKPLIPATVEYVLETSRSTTIGIQDVRVQTVEHVLAAVRACGIDNLLIEIDNIEPPIGNGSSDVFVEMIENAGIVEQESSIGSVALTQPVYHSEGEIHLVALPSPEYMLSYTLSYPEHPLLKAQYHSIKLTPESFKKEIAPCRTFSLYEEVSYLIDKGLIKGGSLDNAVVIKGDAVLSKHGLFFPDEMVRHKVLDLIGDLSLVGIPFVAHIIAIRSGHAANVSFAKKILAAIASQDQ